MLVFRVIKAPVHWWFSKELEYKCSLWSSKSFFLASHCNFDFFISGAFSGFAQVLNCRCSYCFTHRSNLLFFKIMIHPQKSHPSGIWSHAFSISSLLIFFVTHPYQVVMQQWQLNKHSASHPSAPERFPARPSGSGKSKTAEVSFP